MSKYHYAIQELGSSCNLYTELYSAIWKEIETISEPHYKTYTDRKLYNDNIKWCEIYILCLYLSNRKLQENKSWYAIRTENYKVSWSTEANIKFKKDKEMQNWFSQNENEYYEYACMRVELRP